MQARRREHMPRSRTQRHALKSACAYAHVRVSVPHAHEHARTHARMHPIAPRQHSSDASPPPSCHGTSALPKPAPGLVLQSTPPAPAAPTPARATTATRQLRSSPPALPPSRPPALPPGASGADIACVRWACSRADLPHSPPCAPPEPPSCHSIAPLSSVASRANLEWHRPRSSRRRVAGAWRLGGCVPSSLGGCRCLPLSRWLGQCRCRDTRWAGSVSPCLAVTGPAVYSASCPSRLTQLAHLQLRAREFAASALPARARRVGWAGGGA